MTKTALEAFTKTVHIGDIQPHKTAPFVPIFCKVEFHDGRLSISGVIGPKRNGDAWGGCGQICMEFDRRDHEKIDKRNKHEFNGTVYDSTIYADQIKFAPNWNKESWWKFLEVWDQWHLNDMQSACEHQRALGWAYDKNKDTVTEILTPVGHELEGNVVSYTKKGACQTCGYKIGSAWLKMEVPESVIAWLKALPDTDLKPAWV